MGYCRCSFWLAWHKVSSVTRTAGTCSAFIAPVAMNVRLSGNTVISKMYKHSM